VDMIGGGSFSEKEHIFVMFAKGRQKEKSLIERSTRRSSQDAGNAQRGLARERSSFGELKRVGIRLGTILAGKTSLSFTSEIDRKNPNPSAERKTNAEGSGMPIRNDPMRNEGFFDFGGSRRRIESRGNTLTPSPRIGAEEKDYEKERSA